MQNILLLFAIYLICYGIVGNICAMKDKRSKFVELATNRVNRTIKDLRLIGNLSNKSAYECSEDDIKKIVRTLQRELDLMKARFDGVGRGGDNNFSL